MRTFSAAKVACGAHSAPYPNEKTAFLITPVAIIQDAPVISLSMLSRKIRINRLAPLQSGAIKSAV